MPRCAGDAASRLSTDGSFGTGGLENQNSPPWGAALLDFQLALGALHGFAIGDRAMQGENGLRDMEQVLDHQRVGIELFGQANLGRAKLSHAFGVESAGLAVPTAGAPSHNPAP